MNYMKGTHPNEEDITMDTFHTQLSVRLKTDGPTKVLLLQQVDQKRQVSLALTALREKYSSPPSKSTYIDNDSGDDSIHYTPMSSGQVHESDKMASKRTHVDSNEMSLSIRVECDSVSMSVIDSNPEEVLYLSLKGIRMSAERTPLRYFSVCRFSVSIAVKMPLFLSLMFAATLQDMETSNQLLNPSCPIALHPRRAPPGAGSSRLMLPHLHHFGNTYPALHLFVEQKFHRKTFTEPDGEIELKSDDVNDPKKHEVRSRESKSGELTTSEVWAERDAVLDAEEANVLYFDMASIWLAPMSLNVDEDVLLRVIRFVNDLRASTKRSSVATHTRLRDEHTAGLHYGNKSWGTVDPSAVSVDHARLLMAGTIPYTTHNPLAKASQFLFFGLLQLHPLDIVVRYHPSSNVEVIFSKIPVSTLPL